MLRLPLPLIPPPFRQNVQAVSLFSAWKQLTVLDKKLEKSMLSGMNWIIQWPSLEHRNRIYFYSHDDTVRRNCFVKFTFGSPDTERLRNEQRALSVLSQNLALSFSLPTPILTAGEGHYELMVSEAFESGSKPIKKTLAGFPATWIDSYRGMAKTVNISDVQGLEWWGEFAAATGALVHLRQFLAEHVQDIVLLATIHGDLGPGNIRRLPDGSYCIFDWENFTKNGPAETDRLHYWIALHHHRCLNKPANALPELLDFARQQNIKSLDLALSLAFLIAKDSLAALRLGEQWKHIEPGIDP